MKQVYSLFLLFFVLLSCEKEDTGFVGPGNNNEIRFSASVSSLIDTRANVANLDYGMDPPIFVSAPGYGSGAPDQVIRYRSVDGELIKCHVDSIIKRSAKDMTISAWTAPQGVDIGNNTVDFTKDLDKLIGAYTKEDPARTTHSDDISLEFSHLVVKVTASVTNIAGNTSTPITNATISFPAIKQIGDITASLEKHPVVTPGKSGAALDIKLTQSSTSFYLPPLPKEELLMYGSFTVKDGSTSYVGTLYNLGDSIKAGQHIKMAIHVNDDHTASLQAITLAPWTDYPENIYNRPMPGIWGMEDLLLLSKAVRDGTIDTDPEYLGYFYANNDPQKIIRLYTDISLSDATGFEPIGTAENPFKGMTFDGNGYTITGLKLTKSDTGNQGLFGVVEDATLRKVKIKNSTVTGKDNVGMLAGQILAGTTISQCSSQGGKVEGISNVGGLVGLIETGATVINCSPILETVSGTTGVGGMVGTNRGTIANSYVRLSRGVGADENVGGFTGNNYGSIDNCYSIAYFYRSPNKSEGNAGAWIGYNDQAGKSTGSYWNSNCIDNNFCFRIIGNNEQVDDNGLEKLPSEVTGNRFHHTGGYLINSNEERSTDLHTQLNNNRNNISDDELREKYLPWTVIYNSDSSIRNLPVFSNNVFE